MTIEEAIRIVREEAGFQRRCMPEAGIADALETVLAALAEAQKALATMQEVTGSHNAENPWLGVCAAVALLKMECDGMQKTATELFDGQDEATKRAEKAEAALYQSRDDMGGAQQRVKDLEGDLMDALHDDALTEAILRADVAALSRRSEEWAAVVTALGPHAHPGLSPSECVASVVALLADETEMVVGPDGPRAKRSPYLHWRRRAEKAEAKLAEAQGLLNSSEIRSGQVRLIRELAAMEGARDAQRQLYTFELDRAASYERERDEARAEVEGWKNQAQEIAQSNADHVKWHREAEAALAAEREQSSHWRAEAGRFMQLYGNEREWSERLARLILEWAEGDPDLSGPTDALEAEARRIRAALAPALPEPYLASTSSTLICGPDGYTKAPEPEVWRCVDCGEEFDGPRTSHGRAAHAPDCNGNCRNCPVEVECGPITRFGPDAIRSEEEQP